MVQAGVFALAAGYLGWLVFTRTTPLIMLAYLFLLAAGFFGATSGFAWHYRVQRLNTKEREHATPTRANQAPANGFANQVDRSFTRYSIKYGPFENRDRWFSETAGIRNTLRNEIAHIYRESRIGVERINWLIRHIIVDVRENWKSGSLWDYRQTYRVDISTKVRCVVALVVFVPTAVAVVIAAAQAAALPAVLTAIVAAASGRPAATGWLHIISERKRFEEDRQERDRVMADRQAALQKWTAKLDATRPSEADMEAWLSYDKTMLLDEALQVYSLAWRDIVAHTFLNTPGTNPKRAKVNGGQWRYSKYEVRLFLITRDGVREVTSQLDFEHGTIGEEQRHNFRFDAVSSVGVTKAADAYTLDLTLANGPTRSLRVAAAETHDSRLAVGLNTAATVDLDATGFTHTLRVLEGIAAEGKKWIGRTKHLPGASDDGPPNPPEQ